MFVHEMTHGDEERVFVETMREGEPHRDKVLAVVQAHADDIPFFCAGAVAKLVAEGYTAHLIQTTNDEKCGPTKSIGETVLSNEEEVEALAETLDFDQVFNLEYRNHRMDAVSPLELRARLIFLFRLLQVDTVFTFNPWGHGEENPDHYVTAQAVEAACWMAGMDKDYPEHFAAGLEPHAVQEKYYWVARPGQPYNRVVDISDVMDQKIEAMSVNKSQGPAGSQGSHLKERLAARGLRLPELGDTDEEADRAYIELFCLEPYHSLGQRYGLEYAEAFFHIGPSRMSRVEEYVEEHAVSLE